MDARRLGSNVVAIVIIMGLSIIPALYAWFNILSNWDPYGESATSAMNVAVCSRDTGFAIGSASLNVGDTVIEGLEANKTIGWVFTDTEDEALELVYSGDCYAALVIPEDFTGKIISFVSGNPENPEIQYYENSKKNAIATKITSKVKSTVQQTVNTSFVSTLAEVLSKTGEFVTENGSGSVDATGELLDQLDEMDGELTTYINILNTLSLVTDSASGLVDSTQNLLPNIGEIKDSSQQSVASLQGAVLSGAQTADSVAMMVDICLDMVTDGLDTLADQLATADVAGDYAALALSFDTTKTVAKQTLAVLGDLMGDTKVYQNAMKKLDTLETDISTLSEDASLTQEKFDGIVYDLANEIENCNDSLKELKSTFDYEISPALDNDIYDVEYALISAQVLLAGLDTDFTGVNLALQNYKSTLDQGTDNIAATASYVEKIRDGLRSLTDGIRELTEGDEYQEAVETLGTDPSLLAEFVSSPVSMETVPIFEIETYGSAMAPFYTVLALWVGALIMSALLHVKVETAGEDIPGLRHYQAFFGRYITFFLIGQAQTLITVFGDLFYIKIQCLHPFLFWLGSAVTSFVFTLFIYALTVALGNVGQALAVIIMVVQVAGAGCTFPVEVLPVVFQKIYLLLPFTYSMNALRECVGGMYRLEFAKDLGILGIYALLSLLIGLLLVIPFRPVMQLIDRSKEKSGFMV
jgi:putative membrane protein